MIKHTRRHFLLGLGLITTALLICTFYFGISQAYNGSVPGTISGGKKYYEVEGFTSTAQFTLSVSTYQTLGMTLYDEDGNVLETGTSFYHYLGVGTYYIEISIVSGSGTASFTINYQNLYSIQYYDTSAPFNAGLEQLTALSVGAPIIFGVGFAIIGIFGRMKPRSKKGDILLGAPSQLINTAAVAPPSNPPVQEPAPVSSPPAQTTTPPSGAAAVKYCPYCGREKVPWSNTCQGCGNALN